MKNLQPLYTKLGNLYYSIAAADKNITKNEVEALKKQVTQNWLPLENSTDKYGSDAAHYIGIAFDYLVEETMSTAQETWENFEAFYVDNRELFTHELKHKIMETAVAISNSSWGANKAELHLISQLTLLFTK